MENKEKNTTDELKDKATKILNDVKDDSKSFDKKDIDSGKGMAILSYIGILALIPFLSEKKNKFVIYHAKQGMNLFICEIIGSFVIGIVTSILWRLWFVANLIETLYGLAVLALSIIGIVNVCNGKAKELPVINKIKIIK